MLRELKCSLMFLCLWIWEPCHEENYESMLFVCLLRVLGNNVREDKIPNHEAIHFSLLHENQTTNTQCPTNVLVTYLKSF